MKKILKFSGIALLLAGLVFAGYWLYNKIMVDKKTSEVLGNKALKAEAEAIAARKNITLQDAAGQLARKLV